MTVSSAGWPNSSTSPVTTPYIGSSPAVNLAIRTSPTLSGSHRPQGSEASRHIRLGGRPVADGDAEHGPVVPPRTGHPRGAVGQHALDDCTGLAVAAEAGAHLREDDVVEHVGAVDL